MTAVSSFHFCSRFVPRDLATWVADSMGKSKLIIELANTSSSLQVLRTKLKGRESAGYTRSRKILGELCEGIDEKFLLNVLNQMPQRQNKKQQAADLWLALWAERNKRSSKDLSQLGLKDHIVQLATYNFPLTQLLAGEKKHLKVSKVYKEQSKAFSISSFLDLFQIHNTDVRDDPIPSALRQYVQSLQLGRRSYPGGLTILLLFCASGRSSSLCRLLVQGEFSDLLQEPWSQFTLDKLRYRIVKPEYQNLLKLAEGSTSEVVRTASLNHVNFGAHTDWIRDLMVAFPTTDLLMTSSIKTFDGLRAITGLGAFRAVHITCWFYSAHCLPFDVPDVRLLDLFGPNVVALQKNCRIAGFDITELYRSVKYTLPSMEPVQFEIFSCKFMNFVHIMNLHIQPSLRFRRVIEHIPR